jgi:hypothetical protein
VISSLFSGIVPIPPDVTFSEQYITLPILAAFRGDIMSPAMKPMIQREESSSRSNKWWHWRRTILIGMLGIYALMGWLRLCGALTFQDYFTTLNIWPRPIYLAISGGMIGVTFSLAVFFLLFNRRYAYKYARWLAVVFLLWFWADRIWLSVREAFFNQLEIGLLITLVTLIWAFTLIRRNDLHEKPKELEEDGEQTGTGSQVLSE